jgi:hypothetical protein
MCEGRMGPQEVLWESSPNNTFTDPEQVGIPWQKLCSFWHLASTPLPPQPAPVFSSGPVDGARTIEPKMDEEKEEGREVSLQSFYGTGQFSQAPG